jgi:hypothetical protein
VIRGWWGEDPERPENINEAFGIRLTKLVTRT